jgi:hypothetical protein
MHERTRTTLRINGAVPFLRGSPRQHRFSLTDFQSAEVPQDVRIVRVAGVDLDLAVAETFLRWIPRHRKQFFLSRRPRRWDKMQSDRPVGSHLRNADRMSRANRSRRDFTGLNALCGQAEIAKIVATANMAICMTFASLFLLLPPFLDSCGRTQTAVRLSLSAPNI